MIYRNNITLASVFLLSFSTASLACVSQEDLKDAQNSKYTSSSVEDDFCPVAEKWLKEGMCKESRREKILITRLNSYLSEYYENCK